MRLNKRQKIFIIPLFSIIVISIIFLKLQGSPQPNILLITTDALRPDHLGCYGYKRDTSPNIDKLAEEGVKFTQAITQGPWTGPSITSFFTSTYPNMHLLIPGELISYCLNPAALPLTKFLKDLNYITALFVDHSLINKYIRKFKDNFDIYIQIDENNPVLLTQLTIEWLRKNQNKKFFLWAYYFSPHFLI
jgi:membrane-anchored protein YejM (alkaline phosphatase superfamily)